jgi:hypothetical protein
MSTKNELLEGTRLSNWLADYCQDLREDGGFDREATQLEKASQWIADHLAPAQQMQQPIDPDTGLLDIKFDRELETEMVLVTIPSSAIIISKPEWEAAKLRAAQCVQQTHGCGCGPMCESKGLGNCRLHDVSPTRKALRSLVDAVWQHATESTAVPSTTVADKLITKMIIPSAAQCAPQPSGEPTAWRYRFVTSHHGDWSDWFVVDDLNSIPHRVQEEIQPLYASLPAAGGEASKREAETLELGNIVEMRAGTPYAEEWRGVTMKIVGLRVDPDGHRWASVIEGDPRHRGNGVYDSETTDIDCDHLARASLRKDG